MRQRADLITETVAICDIANSVDVLAKSIDQKSTLNKINLSHLQRTLHTFESYIGPWTICVISIGLSVCHWTSLQTANFFRSRLEKCQRVEDTSKQKSPSFNILKAFMIAFTKSKRQGLSLWCYTLYRSNLMCSVQAMTYRVGKR